MNYIKKYLKYKKKYLNLKQSSGSINQSEEGQKNIFLDKLEKLGIVDKFFYLLNDDEDDDEDDDEVMIDKDELNNELNENNIDINFLPINSKLNSGLLYSALVMAGESRTNFYKALFSSSDKLINSTSNIALNIKYFRTSLLSNTISNNINLFGGSKIRHPDTWINISTTIFYLVYNLCLRDNYFGSIYCSDGELENDKKDHLLKLTNLIFIMIKIKGRITMNNGIKEFTTLVNFFKYIGINRFDIYCPPEENIYLTPREIQEGANEYYGCGRCVTFDTRSNKIIFKSTTTTDDNCMTIE